MELINGTTVAISDFADMELVDKAWHKMNERLTSEEREAVNNWRMKLYIFIDNLKILLRANECDKTTKLIDMLKHEIGEIPMFTE